MSQLVFKFPFTAKYYEQDFFVSSNNFPAYNLIESWPSWPGKWLNVFGASGSGKTHLSKILEKKIKEIKLVEAENINDKIIEEMNFIKCLIIDNYQNNIDEKLLYSTLNQANQENQYVVINSQSSIKNTDVNLADLKSRFDSFINLGIKLPTDELLRVILTKSFSDKQIKVNIKLLEYILKNIDRSYEKVFEFIKKIDSESLSTGK